jgi:hypothetical protein
MTVPAHAPERNNLEWLALYHERLERFKKLAGLGAPVQLVAIEAALILDAASHLIETGLGISEEITECVRGFLKRDAE